MKPFNLGYVFIYIVVALAVIAVVIAGNYYAFTFNLWLHEWIGG